MRARPPRPRRAAAPGRPGAARADAAAGATGSAPRPVPVLRQVARDGEPDPHAGPRDEGDWRPTSAVSLGVPRGLRHPRAMVREPGGDEEEVGESVQVGQYLPRRRARGGAAPPPAARRDGRRRGQVEVGGERRAPGRMKWRTAAAPPRTGRSRPRARRSTPARRRAASRARRAPAGSPARRRPRRAGLDPREQGFSSGSLTARAQRRRGRVQLVDGAVRLDTQVVLGDPRSPEEARLSAVTGLRVDFHPSRS